MDVGGGVGARGVYGGPAAAVLGGEIDDGIEVEFAGDGEDHVAGALVIFEIEVIDQELDALIESIEFELLEVLVDQPLQLNRIALHRWRFDTVGDLAIRTQKPAAVNLEAPSSSAHQPEFDGEPVQSLQGNQFCFIV